MEGESGDVAENDEDFAPRMEMLRSFLLRKGRTHRCVLVVCHDKMIRALTGEELGNRESLALTSLPPIASPPREPCAPAPDAEAFSRGGDHDHDNDATGASEPPQSNHGPCHATQ